MHDIINSYNNMDRKLVLEMLIDAHIHISLNKFFSKELWKDSEREQKVKWLREILKQYRRDNILALRDGGDGIFASSLARDIAAEEGIIYKTPVFALYKRGCYGSFLGRPIDDIDGFKKEFKILKEKRLDHLKIILTGIVNFDKFGDVGGTGFTLDELKYMVESAKEYGVPVMVHANGSEGVERAIEAGVDTIEHAYLISERELYGMAQNGIIWIPTLSPLGNILDSKDLRFANEMDIIQKVYDLQVRNIRKAVEIGVNIAIGSDSGAYRVEHSRGTFDEIRHFEDIGLNRHIIEKMCSENGARALGINV